MFACANYPTYPSILASITTEAHYQVRRLRHHPSIVLFAGNNEDHQVRESKNLTYNYEDKNEENWLKSDFPARYIYESLLPRIVREEAPTTPYHPGSPWGDGKETTDPTVGDKHAWNIWHFPQYKYQIFHQLGGRFNSEFGMQAHPHLSTLQKIITGPQDLYPQSRLMDFRNKNDDHERRIAAYVTENVRVVTDLKSHIHLTQLIQSETMSFAYKDGGDSGATDIVAVRWYGR
jgi:beta-mannosidase